MINQLKQDVDFNKIGHAYFFECDNLEVGVKEAKEFAESILGKKVDNNPDFVLVNTDEKSIKVDQIRTLQKDILVKPISSERKVYIILEANKLNVAAQNCLLKTLEEPPLYATLILVAPSVYSVIGTVRSRVKLIKIKSEKDMVTRKEVKEIIDTLKSKNLVEVLKYSEFFDKNKDDIFNVFQEMQLYCNHRILENRNELSGQDFCDTITFAKYIEAINFAEKRIGENSNFSMTIDEMLLKMRG